MRTREEQIEDLASEFVTETGMGDGFSLMKAREHILEAERRAEQRVRAEILHRVTSDENKDRYEDIKEYAEGMSKEFWSTCLRLHPDQDYSSLSAVSIFRCGYDLGVKETHEKIGRDSERLDWLEKTRSVVLEDADNGWCVMIGGIEFSLREETARNAIDAARDGE